MTDNGPSWAAQGLESALGSTASIPVDPTDWLIGLPRPSLDMAPWLEPLGGRSTITGRGRVLFGKSGNAILDTRRGRTPSAKSPGRGGP